MTALARLVADFGGWSFRDKALAARTNGSSDPIAGDIATGAGDHAVDGGKRVPRSRALAVCACSSRNRPPRRQAQKERGAQERWIWTPPGAASRFATPLGAVSARDAVTGEWAISLSVYRQILNGRASPAHRARVKCSCSSCDSPSSGRD
jgi:hypothetical protein